MIRFHLKKAFFDGWDHVLPLMIINLLYLVIPGCLVLVYIEEPVNTPLGITAMMVALLLTVIYYTGVCGITFQWSKYNRTWSKDFFEAIKAKFLHALVLFVLLAVILAVLLYVPYVLSLGNVIYMGLAMLVFWIFFFVILALQFYMPLAFYIKADGPVKTLKKSFILLADNLAFSAWLFVKTLADIVLSVVSVTLVPGLCGISLSQMDGLRLILIRYNYTENNPGVSRRNLDWKVVFSSESKELGR